MHIDRSINLGAVLGKAVPDGGVVSAWDSAFRVTREESVEIDTGARTICGSVVACVALDSASRRCQPDWAWVGAL